MPTVDPEAQPELKWLEAVASVDCNVLHEKAKTYGPSWRKRGGVGAFMMLARKWDRLENIARSFDWNVLAACRAMPEGDASPLEQIRDLRRYLLLVEAYLTSEQAGEHTENGR